MKTVITALIFLYTISSAAQNARYKDGSYFNDDYIHGGQMVPLEPPVDKRYYPPQQSVMVGEPDPNGNRFSHKNLPKPKKRKPAGGFLEVKSSSGSIGTFKEVGGGSSDQSDSLGSK